MSSQIENADSKSLRWGMTEDPIKPQVAQTSEQERRAHQQRLYRRNQVFGLLIIAAAIVAWWLFHTNPAWIFPPGWWRP